MNVTVIKHPVIEHKMSYLRRKETTTERFRQLVREISRFMVYEVTRDLPLREQEIETPITQFTAHVLDGKKMVIIPILRAGLGMVDGILDLVPSAKVGHVGLYRDEETLEAVEYFAKFPSDMQERDTMIVDPMLATGGSAVEAINIVKKRGAKSIKLVCLVGSPEGVKEVNEKHPDVSIYLAALDERLNSSGYIVPGLGDAGDRLFGTK